MPDAPDDARPVPLGYESKPLPGRPLPLRRARRRYPVNLNDGLIVGGLLVLPIYPGTVSGRGGWTGRTTDSLLWVWWHSHEPAGSGHLNYAYPGGFLIVYAVLLLAGMWLNHRVAARRARR